jgi:prephenate dehydrogenase
VKPGRVVIAGLGLIGGSLARDLTRLGWHVTGVDRAPVRRRARRAGALAASSERLEPVLADADLLLIATPPRASLALLRRVARVAPELCVSDVVSVKRPICHEAERLGLVGFVGGHPLAGSESGGFRASREGLFRDRRWALCPLPATRPGALRRVRTLVRALGARPELVDPQRHDRALAVLSHLPQLMAWALVGASLGLRPAERRLAGPAFAQMTRLARSPRPLWREILKANRDEVERALDLFRRELGRRPRE